MLIRTVCLSVYRLSGFYSDPPEGCPTYRRSGLTGPVIHRSRAVQRHPLGSGVSDNQSSYKQQTFDIISEITDTPALHYHWFYILILLFIKYMIRCKTLSFDLLKKVTRWKRESSLTTSLVTEHTSKPDQSVTGPAIMNHFTAIKWQLVRWYPRYQCSRTLVQYEHWTVSVVIEYPPIPGCTEQGHQRNPTANPWSPKTGHCPAQPRGKKEIQKERLVAVVSYLHTTAFLCLVSHWDSAYLLRWPFCTFLWS